MSWLDIAILVVLAIATVIGLRIGIIKAVLSLVGLIVGVILAGLYYVSLSEQLSFIQQADVAKIVAFAIILVGVMLVALVLSRLFERTTSMLLLGWVNRLGGAALGLALGALLCGALLATWVKFLGPASAIAESGLATILLSYFSVMLALLPEGDTAIRSFLS